MTRSLCRAAAALVPAGALALLAAGLLAFGPATPTAAAWESTPDYLYVLQTISDLRAHPPADPLVVLFGGSSARSSTVSDASWSKQVSKEFGAHVVTLNLGSHERMLIQDLHLVNFLPEVHPIVIIGVNVGRFCSDHADPKIVLPEPSGAGARGAARGEPVHRLSDQRKRQIAAAWMPDRYPFFRKNVSYNLGVLARACEAALKAGAHPVILDLPRNMDIIGHQLDVPMAKYHAGCRAIAKRLHIPFVEFQSKTHLHNLDFRDIWHTVPSGRVKWQKQLSVVTARLLKSYAAAPQPTASPTAAPAQ